MRITITESDLTKKGSYTEDLDLHFEVESIPCVNDYIEYTGQLFQVKKVFHNITHHYGQKPLMTSVVIVKKV